jgi:hypothetical protein
VGKGEVEEALGIGRGLKIRLVNPCRRGKITKISTLVMGRKTILEMSVQKLRIERA